MEFTVRTSNSIDSQNLRMKKYFDLPFPSVLQEIAHKPIERLTPCLKRVNLIPKKSIFKIPVNFRCFTEKTHPTNEVCFALYKDCDLQKYTSVLAVYNNF